MKKNKSGILIKIGLMLIVCALILSGYNVYQEYSAYRKSQSIASRLSDEINKVEEIDDSYLEYPKIPMPVEVVDGYNFIGVIHISKLNLDLPIMDQWSYKGLKFAPGRYKGSLYTNDLIVAAHNYSTHFGRLKNLTIGDKLSITDMSHHTFNYEIINMELLKGTDVDEMTSGKWDLTLFTCTYGGRQRVTIRCRRLN